MPQKGAAPVSLVEDHLGLKARQESASISYCDSCGLCLHQTRITCAACVNTGRFGPSKQKQSFSNAIHKSDHQPTMNTFTDRMVLLKQLNQGRQFYRSEMTQSLEPFTVVQQMSSEIEQKKARLRLVRHSISKLREEIERKRRLNATIRQRIEHHVAQVALIRRGCIRCDQAVLTARDKLQQKRDTLLEQLNITNLFRKQRIQILSQHIFRLEHVSMIEEDAAARNQALNSAQRDTDDDHSESDDFLIVECDRYQIVSSSLLGNGDFEIDKLLRMVNLGEDETFDPESPEASLRHELCQIISGLSHACQLTNTLAFFFQVHLPFKLHHRCFNNGPYKIDEIQKNIARLNTNIVTICLSQDVPIDHHHFAHTLANLHKLVTSPCHPHRSVPVEYSKEYLALISEQTMDVDEAYIFAPELYQEEEEIDPQSLGEWESLPHDVDIPDDLSTDERTKSLPCTVADPPATGSRAMEYLSRGFAMFSPILYRSKS